MGKNEIEEMTTPGLWLHLHSVARELYARGARSQKVRRVTSRSRCVGDREFEDRVSFINNQEPHKQIDR